MYVTAAPQCLRKADSCALEESLSSVIKPNRKQITIFVVVFLVSLVADLASKEWAVKRLAEDPIGQKAPLCVKDSGGYITLQRVRKSPVTIVQNHLELRYAENCSAAFNLGESIPYSVRSIGFNLASVIAVLALCWYFWSGRGGPRFEWSGALIAGGALGNLVDRVRYGYVVDFIRFYWEKPFNIFGTVWTEYPTFNIADSTILIGVILMFFSGPPKDLEVVSSTRSDKNEKNAGAEKDTKSAPASESPAA